MTVASSVGPVPRARNHLVGTDDQSRQQAAKIWASPATQQFMTFVHDWIVKTPNFTTLFTNTSTVGAVTLNVPVGQAIVAAAASSVVVTNNLVTATSQILATAAKNDTTGYVKNVVAGAGSFTINLGAAATANLPINFLVLNS